MQLEIAILFLQIINVVYHQKRGRLFRTTSMHIHTLDIKSRTEHVGKHLCTIRAVHFYREHSYLNLQREDRYKPDVFSYAYKRFSANKIEQTAGRGSNNNNNKIPRKSNFILLIRQSQIVHVQPLSGKHDSPRDHSPIEHAHQLRFRRDIIL